MMVIIVGLSLALLISLSLNYALLEPVCYDDELEIENAKLKVEIMELTLEIKELTEDKTDSKTTVRIMNES